MKLVYQSKPKVKFQNLSKEDWKEKLLFDLKKIPGFYKAYFFGSFARGEDGPWSDVDIVIVLEDAPQASSDGKNSNENVVLKDVSNSMHYVQHKKTGNFFQNLVLVSDYIGDYPELEPIVYTKNQWEAILDDPHPIGFWKDVRNDLVELETDRSIKNTRKLRKSYNNSEIEKLREDLLI